VDAATSRKRTGAPGSDASSTEEKPGTRSVANPTRLTWVAGGRGVRRVVVDRLVWQRAAVEHSTHGPFPPGLGRVVQLLVGIHGGHEHPGNVAPQPARRGAIGSDEEGWPAVSLAEELGQLTAATALPLGTPGGSQPGAGVAQMDVTIWNWRVQGILSIATGLAGAATTARATIKPPGPRTGSRSEPL
jgi:hypothetical protein